jgi:hypothetical protein
VQGGVGSPATLIRSSIWVRLPALRFMGRSFNGRKSRLHRENGSSILSRSNFASEVRMRSVSPAKAGWLSAVGYGLRMEAP